MIFDVNIYYRNIYVLFFPLAFSVMMLSSFVSELVKTARQKETGLLRAVFSIDKFYALALPIALFFAVMVFRTMNDHGFALIGDRSSDPLEMTGTVEGVEMLDPYSGQKYSFEGKTYFGSKITIDGSEYLAMTAGPYQSGDTVTIEYLPKSHCVIRLTGDRDPEQTAQAHDTQSVIPAENETVPRAVIILEAAVLVLIDTLLIIAMRKNLYRFLTDAESREKARAIYDGQSPGARVFLGFIRPYVKNGMTDFSARHKLYLAEILTLIPQYAYLLIHSIMHGEESGFGYFYAALFLAVMKSVMLIEVKIDSRGGRTCAARGLFGE